MESESVNNESEPTTESPRKPRSNVERAITWGVILILLVVVYFEWRARNGYNSTLNAIADARTASENDPSRKPVTLSDVENLVNGSPTKAEGTTALNRTVSYTWRGLTGLRSYTILVTLEGIKDTDDPLLLSFETGSMESSHDQILTEGAPDPKQFFDDNAGQSTEDESADATGGQGGGFGDGNSGGRSGGGRPPSWEDLDKDSDGKVTKEEAPERMQPFFDRIDENSDGVIDKEEFDSRRQRFRRGGGDGQGPPNRPERPQRPEAESDDDTPDKKTPDKDSSDAN